MREDIKVEYDDIVTVRNPTLGHLFTGGISLRLTDPTEGQSVSVYMTEEQTVAVIRALQQAIREANDV